jgi:cytochrome c oxidase subunit III
MATVYPFPRALQQEKDATNYVGIVLFLGSWAVLFAGLFFSYGILRLKASHWPPVGVPQLPLLAPGVASLILLASSVTLWVAYQKKSLTLFVSTILLGLVFLGLQASTWLQLWERGLQLDSGAYGGVFYLMTSFHALHVVGGLLALLWFLPAASKRGLGEVAGLKPIGLLWHFIDAVWWLMFLAVYVV